MATTTDERRTEVAAREARDRRRWLVLTAVVAAVAALTALFGYGLSRDPRSILSSPLVGKPAPDFALPALEGDRTIRLSDLRGQVVVINFWASWCAPCREEHRALQDLWDRYRDRGMVLLGIVYQDTETGARAFRQELGGDWPVLMDPESRAAIDYGVFGAPETVIVRPDGVVAEKIIGQVSYPELSTWIERLSGGTP
jgi:cytochrome c biogenesis protein CcmG/thiol:disulfide interchange protein DsbE